MFTFFNQKLQKRRVKKNGLFTPFFNPLASLLTTPLIPHFLPEGILDFKYDENLRIGYLFMIN